MSKRSIRPDDLNRIVFVGDAQISPDGNRVLFSRKTITAKNEYLTQLWTVDMEGGLVPWTQGEKSSAGGRWSPDGSRIAFTSGRDGTAELFVISTDGGEARRVSGFGDGSIGEYRWSPDATKIALTFRPQLEDRTKAATKEREEKGLSEPPIAYDSVLYRLDGDGYFGNQRYRLIVIDVAAALAAPGSEASVVLQYAADAHGEYDFDWSPDSQELAVIHNATPQPFIDPPNRQIWRLKMDGTARQLPGLPAGTKQNPRWSPDGLSIAYTGDVDELDPWGTRNTKLYLVGAEGGEPLNLSGGQDFDLDVATLSDTKEATFGAVVDWAPDGSGLYVQIGWHGETQLGFVAKTGGVEVLTEGHHSLAVGNVSRGGRRVAGVLGSAVKLPEVVIIERELVTGRPVPRFLTDFNREFHDDIQLAEPEEVWIPSTDGMKVHGWVMRGPSTGKVPAILQVHGGPHTQYGWAFFHEMQCQAADGYVVVYTNPRGSKGYGEAWTAAIRGDWGNKDWEDVRSVAEWMKAQPYIDGSRMAIMGGSYGGYMTNWVIGHTKDFACAITDRCVSNFVSMAGNSDFPFNKDGYFRGVAYGSLDDIKELWRQSPLAYFQGVTTPTLVIHSAGDLRCNIEQGEQVFSALQMQGVPSRMVRYPFSTSHGMSRSGPPDLRMHRLDEILSWLRRFLSPA